MSVDETAIPSFSRNQSILQEHPAVARGCCPANASPCTSAEHLTSGLEIVSIHSRLAIESSVKWTTAH